MLILLASSILRIDINGPITPITSNYVKRAIKVANEKNYNYLLIIINTPGGLESAMRDIVKEILNSKVKTIAFVYPSGSRAASAGVFITLSANITAMASGTNMGSASPVSLTGGMDTIMQKKVMNDANAFLRSILKARNKDELWADSFVLYAKSYSSTELKKFGLIDYIADDIDALLDSVGIKDKRIDNLDMTLREKILEKIADPNIAYFLLIIGLYGIIFELASPGWGISGTIGVISLLLALFALQVLSANLVGLLLIVIAFIMFFAEVKLQTGGLLGVGGTIAFIIGSLMLFDISNPQIRISIFSIITATILTLIFFFILVAFAIKALKQKPQTGSESLVGKIATAIEDFENMEGRVMLLGEIWFAQSNDNIKKGDKVQVLEIDGLTLKVKKL
ncbi:MAG: nodulation protein NfeD [candidate division WOR-3 bacterium]|nr:nodulation protein NfeD [candidate division WOR-3 bacterium]